MTDAAAPKTAMPPTPVYSLSGSRVLVAGASGLVGSAVSRRLNARGVEVVELSSQDVDLRDPGATRAFVQEVAPDVVVDAAARVGGIAANAARPVDFLNDNLRIQTSLFEAAHDADVQRLLFLGSSCIYPKFAPQPIPESALMSGALEPTNDAYAVAKIAGIVGVQAYRRQFGRSWIAAMPTNLYGPRDNFDPESSHVLPALLRRFHEAATTDAEEVLVWGSGTPRREFLHVDDLASACVHLVEHYDGVEPVNVGTGTDISIAELAATISEIVGFTGRVGFDAGRPDGTPRKLLDVAKLHETGWRPGIGLREGITSTYRWFLDHVAERPIDANTAANGTRA